MKAYKFLSVIVVLLFVAVCLHPEGAQSFAAFDGDGVLPTNQLIIKYTALEQVALTGPTQVNEMMRLSAVAGIELSYVRLMSGNAHVLRLPQKMPMSDVKVIAARLAALPDVEYAEPDQVMLSIGLGVSSDVEYENPNQVMMAPMDDTAIVPNDPRYTEQWHYFDPASGSYGINTPNAWDIASSAGEVVVAVVDTGITSHPELDGKVVAGTTEFPHGGYDFVSNEKDNDGEMGRDTDPSDPGNWVTEEESTTPGGDYHGCTPTDSTWHGTRVAGLVAATTNNASGVAGINWNAKILPVRVIGKCSSTSSDVIDGMRWAAGLEVPDVEVNPNPAKVINLSLAIPDECSQTTQDAINEIVGTGVVIVVGSGDEGGNSFEYTPGNCDGVITVVATNREGFAAAVPVDEEYSIVYSNLGPDVEISAPGGETRVDPSRGILSTTNDGIQSPGTAGYGFYQGTSEAAAHVSGVASLLLTANPDLDAGQVLDILRLTATNFPSGSSCGGGSCGAGIVNAYSALAPRITSLDPPYSDVGVEPFELFINGINFNETSVVYFNGIARTADLIDSTLLSLMLTPADLSADATYPIYVSGSYGQASKVINTSVLNFIVGTGGGPSSTFLPLIMRLAPGMSP